MDFFLLHHDILCVHTDIDLPFSCCCNTCMLRVRTIHTAVLSSFFLRGDFVMSLAYRIFLVFHNIIELCFSYSRPLKMWVFLKFKWVPTYIEKIVALLSAEMNVLLYTQYMYTLR